MSSRPLALLTRALPFLACMLASACEGPNTPALVKGEPVCKDFAQAGDQLKGGLKQPVRLRMLDGEDVIATVMLYGIPESAKQPTRFLLPDHDDKYALEWAQCKNERAPTTADPRDRAASAKQGSAYECGEVDVYEKADHTIEKGNPKTHELTWVAPPNPTCW